MVDLTIATIAYNKPWAISEQIRLFNKHLVDNHVLYVFDNSSEVGASQSIERICGIQNVRYTRLITSKHYHHEALNVAAHTLTEHCTSPYIGFVDHDVFPTTSTSLINKINKTGFLTVGQRHTPTQNLYPWPGFFFMSKEWLAERKLNFDGIKGKLKRDDGDTGSMNHHLFSNETFDLMYPLSHGYENVRVSDTYGIQSYGIELIGDFIHLTNTSGWMSIPNPSERERLVQERIAAL